MGYTGSDTFFTVPNFSDTGSETFFQYQFFPIPPKNKNILLPVRHTLIPMIPVEFFCRICGKLRGLQNAGSAAGWQAIISSQWWERGFLADDQTLLQELSGDRGHELSFSTD